MFVWNSQAIPKIIMDLKWTNSASSVHTIKSRHIGFYPTAGHGLK